MSARRLHKPRLAWALTGSGHFFSECFAMIAEIAHVDLFVTRAAAEVVRRYRHELNSMPAETRVFRDTTASAAPVGLFYEGVYHTLVVAPATSNTVAKCVYGISDTLATNVYAQAGKCRVPAIVFACDTAPELTTMAPTGPVKVFPRRIDLDNVDRLKRFEATIVVESLEELRRTVWERLACTSASSC
jgi:dihydromethanopterin reductase (acceptor)